MRVLLRQHVSGVGRRGDIVDVTGGFARNYLFPGGAAIAASDGVEAQAAAMRRSRDLRDSRDREAAESKARVLAGKAVTVRARAGSGGRLFGSVGPSEIIDAVAAEHGVTLERGTVRLEEPIKVAGSEDVQLVLHADVVIVLTIQVEPLG